MSILINVDDQYDRICLLLNSLGRPPSGRERRLTNDNRNPPFGCAPFGRSAQDAQSRLHLEPLRARPNAPAAYPFTAPPSIPRMK